MENPSRLTKTVPISLICPENDLESKTILELAAKHGIDIRKSKQPWGARLEKEPEKTFKNLKKTVIIVEIPGPEKEAQLRREGHELIIIDHHQYNELDRTHHLSSLEQFTEFLNIDINRPEYTEYQYIAANDRDFLYGLIEAGADYETMCRIREKERKITGISPELYAEAKQSIKHKWDFGDLVICIAPEKYHRPLGEIIRFPGRKSWQNCQKNNKTLVLKNCLIICHSNCVDPAIDDLLPCQIELYGPAAWRQALTDIVEDLNMKAQFRMWCGGGSHSCFFGATPRRKGASWDKLLSLLLEFSLTSGRPVRSWNTTFIFPFILTKGDKRQKAIPCKDAEESPHIVNDDDSIAAALYFLPTVRKLFFSTEKNKTTNIKRIALKQKHLPQNRQLILTQGKDNAEIFKAKLNLEEVAIYSFANNDIQMLSFKVSLPAIEKEISFDNLEQPLQLFGRLCKDRNLDNALQSTRVSHLLKINNLLRILYKTYTAQKKENKILDRIDLKWGDIKITAKLTLPRIKDSLPKDLDPSLSKDLVPSISEVISFLICKLVETDEKDIAPLLDDRLFLISHFVLWGNKPEKKVGREYYESLYSLGLYVDTQGWSEPAGFYYDPDVVKESLKSNTDKRWYGPAGNLYGYTDYSNIYMGYGKFFVDEISSTIHNHYFYFAILTLYHRVSLLDYIHRLSMIGSEDIKTGGRYLKISEKVQQIRSEFISFDSIFYHREISAALQAGELYNKCRQAMKVERLYEQVRQKLQQLDEFLQAKRASFLNKYGIWLAIAALFPAILGTFQATPEKLLFFKSSRIKEILLSYISPDIANWMYTSCLRDTLIAAINWTPYIFNAFILIIFFIIILRWLYKYFSA